jgi:hypothetical protein
MKCSTLKHGGSENKILPLDDARARIGPMMRSPRPLLTGWAPKSLFNPQARHWGTPTCHSSRNTQACLHTFKYTSKAWATKAQQDWPINGITSRSPSPSCSPPPLITFSASTDHMVSNPNVPSPSPHGFLTASPRVVRYWIVEHRWVASPLCRGGCCPILLWRHRIPPPLGRGGRCPNRCVWVFSSPNLA